MKSISVKLIATALVIVSVTNAAFLIIARNMSTKELKASIESDMNNTASLVAAQIQAINEGEVKMLTSLGKMPIINGYDDDKQSGMRTKWNWLNAIAANDKTYLGMALYDENGVGWTTTGNWSDLSSREYLAEAIKTRKPFIMKPNWSPVNGNVSTFYAVPYFTGTQMRGIIVAVLDGLNLSYVVQGITVGKKSHPQIIEMKTGSLVASERIEDIQEQKNIRDGAPEEFLALIDKACLGQSGAATWTDPKTKETHACVYKPVGGTADWAVIISTPVNDFFGGLSTMVRILTVVFLISTIAAILIIGGTIIRAIKPLKKLRANLNEIATGSADLTKRIEVSSEDEVGDVVHDFNLFTEKLHSIVSDIKESKEELNQNGSKLLQETGAASNSIEGILSSINNVDSQIEKQTGDVNQTASAVNEIASNITSLEKMVENQSYQVQNASAAVEQMIQNILNVDQTANKLASSFAGLLTNVNTGAEKQNLVNDRISEIEDQSKMLQEANLAISNIAEQTNLLAMNAAIEAAHAGESGKGFAVVAGEIRKLSETSSKQSKTIQEQLSKITDSIKNVVDASGQSTKAFREISDRILGTDTLVQQIKNAMHEQNVGSEQISGALTTMNDSTLDVKQAAREMSEGNKIILDSVKELQESTYRIKDSMQVMAKGADTIGAMGRTLTSISDGIEISIDKIGNQIDQFQV